MTRYRQGKSPRPKLGRLGGLADYKKLGWRIGRNSKKRRGGWTASKRGVKHEAPCTRSLMNRMQATEARGKWPK